MNDSDYNRQPLCSKKISSFDEFQVVERSARAQLRSRRPQAREPDVVELRRKVQDPRLRPHIPHRRTRLAPDSERW